MGTPSDSIKWGDTDSVSVDLKIFHWGVIKIDFESKIYFEWFFSGRLVEVYTFPLNQINQNFQPGKKCFISIIP